MNNNCIYIIENSINNKKYIGKTINIKKRMSNHFSKTASKRDKGKVLYKAMKKHGPENFSYRVLEDRLSDSEWPSREVYWIEVYSSMIPNGYNMIDGGTEPPRMCGDDHPLTKITEEIAMEIISTIKDTEMLMKDIAKKFGVSIDVISRINLGLNQKVYDGVSYPVRPLSKISNHIEEIIELLSLWTMSCKEIADIYGVSKSTIKAVNNGQNWLVENIEYPIKPPHVGASKETYAKAYKMIKLKKDTKEIVNSTGLSKTRIERIQSGVYDKYLISM